MEIELCVASPEAARLAENFPVTRIETCAALEVGGLTPELGFVNWIRDTFHLEQHILVRSRIGHFVYTNDEIIIMRDQIAHFYQLGYRGFVVGALTYDSNVNEEALSVWKRAAPEASFTFHRAFDDCENWEKGMRSLIKLGFKRILTSGGLAQLDSANSHWKSLINHAQGEIEIMAGGGLKPNDLAVFHAIGINAVHFSGTIQQEDTSSSLFAEKRLIPNEEKMKLYFDAMNQLK